MDRKAVSGIMLTLISMGLLGLTLNTKLVAAAYYYNFEIAVIPESPTDSDLIEIKVSFDTASISYAVTFGSLSQMDNQFCVDVIIDVPQVSLWMIGYAEKAYHLGTLPVDTYSFNVNITVTGYGWGNYHHSRTFSVASSQIPEPTTWTVDDDGPADFSSIQEAINSASPEDTIFVHSGTYYENVVVNKTVSLVGENKTTTIIDGSGEGVVFQISRTQNVSVDSFAIRNGTLGLSLDDSSCTCFRNVDLVGSEYNFRFGGIFWEHFYHDIDTSNTVNYKPIYYWVNKQDKEVPIDAGYVALINCSRIVMRNLSLEHNYDGITLFSVRNSLVENVSISNTLHGLYLRWNCTNNIIQRNFMTNNSVAIVLQRASSNNNVSGNIIVNNNDGIGVDRSLNNSLSRNFIANNENGICLFETRNNIISENDILNNTRGIRIQDAYNNSIYHNNFINNEYQVYPLSRYTISTNLWDDGYPSGGNCWSDYVERYPDAKELDDSGMWDTPYFIDENNQDNYPLMEPWSPKPPRPAEATQELIETTESWNLFKGIETSLIAKLDNAIHLLDKGNEKGAIHKLIVFINKVEVLRGKKLTNEQTDYLIAEAQRIIDLIEGLTS